MAALTRSAKDAETKDHLNVSINIDGNDVVSRDTLQWAILRDDMIPRGNASIAPVPSTVTEPISFDSASLTNSSIRVGITGDNMWAPEHILLLGREDTNDRYIPLAGEWDVNTRLSTDFSDTSPDAKLTIPLRLIRLGGIGTTIRRVLLLVKTSHVDDAGSRDPIVLEITAGGTPVLNQAIGDTSQDDRFEKSDNWYTLDVMDPFNKRNVMSNGGITLSIIGRDAWLPKELYLFGLDTAEGRPSAIVPLVSVSSWNLGWLSEDTSEGQPSVPLPIS